MAPRPTFWVWQYGQQPQSGNTANYLSVEIRPTIWEWQYGQLSESGNTANYLRVAIWPAIWEWQHAQLCQQVRTWDTRGCCWDVKQTTDNMPANPDSTGLSSSDRLLMSRSTSDPLSFSLSAMSARCPNRSVIFVRSICTESCWWRYWRQFVLLPEHVECFIFFFLSFFFFSVFFFF